ncbi:MFS transporter [Glutamicibacter sp. BW80]|uniref:MFS transporter n=1 Tax=unclassified Glutamicibacter TaxID=2627139 RepID=UPI000BB916FC|nr:MFS transporter [Glutamicibacter sp. BW80]PCC30465.1 MFS transporter [Glutamicibacter sp. BW80]
MVQQGQGSRLGGVIAAASIPMFMAALDNLVMTFALPVIRDDLGATLTELQWFVNIYTLLFATLMMPAAALGDRVGRRRVFLAGIVIFTAASVGAALSDSVTALILARAIQGVGAAAIVPLSLTILSVASPPARRAMAIGIWGGVNGLGIAVGPIVGGAVLTGLHWSAIFWLNLPIGALALILGWRLLPESLGRPSKFDALGIVLAAVFVLPLTWAIVEGIERGWTATPVLAAFALSAAGLIGFLFREHYSSAAFLPLRLFQNRTFSLANLAGFLFSAGVFGAIFLLSQFLQVSMGYGALEAGLRATPWTLAPMFVAPLAGLLVARIGVRTVLITGMSLQTLALLLMTLIITADVEYPLIVAPMLLAGIGMGLSFAPLSTAVLTGRPDTEHGIASGVNSTLRQLGIAVGIAICTAIFATTGEYLPGQPFVDGLQPALIVCTVILAVATLSVAVLPQRAKHLAHGSKATEWN